MRVAEKLPGFKGWQDWERDIAALLSFIPDVVRACAATCTPEDDDCPCRGCKARRVCEQEILSILDNPIKSESDIRRDTAREIVEELEGDALGLVSGWGSGSPPDNNIAAANMLRMKVASIRTAYGVE